MPEFDHPSYVLVSFSRRQGSPKLFGSALTQHYNYVTLQVKKATLIRDDTGDRYHSSMCGDVIEVDLSAAQFAELLTTMNIGLGVPGTLRRLLNERVEEPPDLANEVEEIQDQFANNFRAFAKTLLENSLPKAREILAKPTITKADRQALIGLLEKVSVHLNSNVPFILEMVNESIGKRMSSAKAELDSFLVTILHKAGLKSLQGKDVSQLPESTEGDS